MTRNGGVLLEGGDGVGRDVHGDVQVALLELQPLGPRLVDALDDDALELVGERPHRVRIGLVDHVHAAAPRREHVGAGARGVVLEPVGREVAIFLVGLDGRGAGHERERQPGHQIVRLREQELQGAPVDDFHLAHVLEGFVGAALLALLDALDVGAHRLGVELRAVGELHSTPQREGVGLAVGRDVPLGGQVRR
jgi:hypothetical protein